MGWSIHSTEKDFSDLTLLQEGADITLADCTYIIRKGRFILSPKV